MNKKTVIIRSKKKRQSLPSTIFTFFLKRKAVSFFILLLLILAIPLTILQGKRSQDIRQRASGDAAVCIAQCQSTYGNTATEPICNAQRIALCQGRTINEGCKLEMNKCYQTCSGGIGCQQRCQEKEAACEQKCTADNCTAPVACEGECLTCKNKCATTPAQTASSELTCAQKCAQNSDTITSDTVACLKNCKETASTTSAPLPPQEAATTETLQEPTCNNSCEEITQTCTDTGCNKQTSCNTECSSRCFKNNTCTAPKTNTVTPPDDTPSAPGIAPNIDPCMLNRIGGKPCDRPVTPSDSGPSTTGTKAGSGIKNAISPKPQEPSLTATPQKQVTCSDNPIQAPFNQIWKAYCSNRCVTNSDCKSLPGWSAQSSQCYSFTNGSYCIQLQYNNIAGVCRDNPVPPPDGLMWKAACSGQPCTKNSDCPTTPGMENSNWCYGFDDGARCLQLQVANNTSAHTSASPSATTTTTKLINAIKTPFVSAWHTISTWLTHLFH